MSDTDQIRASQAEPPLSITPASVDDKGRLKLPADFQSYLEATGIERVFITTMDLRQARIYPMELWKENLQFLQSLKEKAAAGERLALIAKVHGGEAEIKGGRVLLPLALREALGLKDKQPVWLDAFKGRINLVTQDVHDARMKAARATMVGDLETLEMEGLQ